MLTAVIERGYLTYGVDLSPDFCFQYPRISAHINIFYKSKLIRAKWRTKITVTVTI